MAAHAFRVGAVALLAACSFALQAQQGDVFVVGRDTATSDLIRPFKATHVSVPDGVLDMAGRQDLMRGLLAELGFATRAIPIGPPGILLHVNGRMEPTNDELQTRLYKRGISVNAGDRFQITALHFNPDSIVIDLNGGPYPKHRYLSHIEINGMALAPQQNEAVVGSRIILQFEGPVPAISASEVKLLLEPILDFGVKNGDEAYAETLPEPIKLAIEQHDVLVGMSKRMVLAALGQPAMKVREHPDGGPDGEVLEEWIYGKVPQPIQYVRFRGDQVCLLKIAAVGKPIEVHDKNELAGFKPPENERIIHMGDTQNLGEEANTAKPPSLLDKPADTAAAPAKTKTASSSTPAAPSQFQHLM